MHQGRNSREMLVGKQSKRIKVRNKSMPLRDALMRLHPAVGRKI
jgi:hypothetical protein